MSTKELKGSDKNKEGLVSNWRLWCRLCAKIDSQNINVFFKDESTFTSLKNNIIGNESDKPSGSELGLTSVIVKHFGVKMKREEQFPQMLCTECFSLVTSLVNFVERVEKVQLMYNDLQQSQECNPNEFRIKYGLRDEDRQHIFLQPPMPEVHYLDKKLNALEADVETISDGHCSYDQPSVIIEVKKETLAQSDEADTCEYENDFEEQADPFGGDNAEDLQEFYSDNEDNTNLAALKTVLKAKRKFSEETQPKKGRGKKRKIQKDNDTEPNDELEKSDDLNSTDINERKESAIDDNSESTEQPKSSKSSRIRTKRKYKSKSPPREVSCSQCSRVFKTQKQLDRHSRKHLPMELKRVVPCPYCDKKFTSKYFIEPHIKYVHMNERSIICEECGCAVRTIGALREHMLTHTDYAPFECDVCHKGFKNKWKLNKHKETHDEKKHVCAECGKLLNSRTTLNQHLLVHSDKMQHKCDYCGRAFKRAKTLKNHLITHTGLKPYSCDFCDRTYTTGPSCRLHKKKAHPKELAELEASGAKTFTKNIPTIEALKAYARNIPKAEPELTTVMNS